MNMHGNILPSPHITYQLKWKHIRAVWGASSPRNFKTHPALTSGQTLLWRRSSYSTGGASTRIRNGRWSWAGRGRGARQCPTTSTMLSAAVRRPGSLIQRNEAGSLTARDYYRATQRLGICRHSVSNGGRKRRGLKQSRKSRRQSQTPCVVSDSILGTKQSHRYSAFWEPSEIPDSAASAVASGD